MRWNLSRLSRCKRYLDILWHLVLDPAAEAAMGHIELARWADLVIIAPATANLLARINAGMADELITTTCLATEAPIALCPAMNQQMYRNLATQANLTSLQSRGYTLGSSQR